MKSKPPVQKSPLRDPFIVGRNFSLKLSSASKKIHPVNLMHGRKQPIILKRNRGVSKEQQRRAFRLRMYKRLNTKQNLKYIRHLKRFVLWKKKRVRVRFLYSYINTTKHAILQYYRKFSLRNFSTIVKLYRLRRSSTRYERFLAFFELRIVNILVRIGYSKYILYSNLLIHNGDIRVNNHILLLYDYQICLHDLIEISYRGFFRQCFKKFIFRKFWAFKRRASKGFFFLNLFDKYKSIKLINKAFPFIPWVLFQGGLRLFRSSRLYSALRTSTRPDFFVQNVNVLATIIFSLPRRFSDRKFSNLFTKKHMRLLSNFCTVF